jgi:SPP1 family predicted phage head-tail adaptor
MGLKAGRLRHLVSLQKAELSQDSNGDAITEWLEVAKVRAEIVPLSVKEFMNAHAQQSGVDTRITIRRRSGVNASMRMVHRQQVYDIQGVLPDPDSGLEYLSLPCVSGLIEPDDIAES